MVILLYASKICSMDEMTGMGLCGNYMSPIDTFSIVGGRAI